MVRKLGIPPESLDPLRYAGPRFNLIPVTESVRRPAIYDRNYPLFTLWRLQAPTVSPAAEGEIWYLSRFADAGDSVFQPGDAVWLMFGSGSAGAITNLRTDDTNLVTPLAGIIDANGVTVANATNATPLFTDGATANTSRWELQVGADVTGAPADMNDAGIVSFDDTQFTVDANGYVILVGGAGLPPMQTLTSDDPTIVGPDGSGNIDLTGEAVTNATNAKPVFVDAGTNALNIEVQVAAPLAAAPADNNDAGLASFDNLDFGVDTNGFVTLDNPPTVGGPGATNIGFNYNGGTGVFTVSSKDGTALSSTNVARVTVQSQSVAGQLVTINVTADQSFIDDAGTSEIIGNLFGLTTSIAWANAMPFFVYAVPNDAESAIAFMISRSPAAKVSPAAANIGAPDDAVADAQADFWSLDNIDETLYDANPCVCIGSFRMVMSASDDWTVQALDESDGPGNYQENINFTMPEGQMGAAASTYVLSNAGTEPQWATQTITYSIQRNGMAYIRFEGQIADVAGVGANEMSIVLPYTPVLAQVSYVPFMYTDFSGTLRRLGSVGIAANANATSTSVTSGFVLDSGTANLTNAVIETSDSLQFIAYYRAFGA